MSQPVKMENELLSSEGHGNSVPEKFLNFLPGVVCFLDSRRNEVTYISERISDLLGYTIQEFNAFPKNWLSIVLDDDKALYQEQLDMLSRANVDYSSCFVVRCHHKDGSCKFIRINGSVLRGELPRIALFLEDITAQVKFEEDAIAGRQLFDETEKLILYGTWTWNARSNKVEWTEGMRQLLGYGPEDELVVDNDFYLKHVLPEYVENLQHVVSTAIANRTDFDAELVIRTKTGKEKFVFMKGKPILDREGNLKKYLVITRDVTNKKSAEKERERRIRELNRSNKELEEFAYVASHDMHEPIRKILTFGEKISNKFSSVLGTDGQIYLDRMVSAATNMRHLIDNLLEFSRVSRGARAFESCDLNEILQQVISDQELRIEETATKIKVRDLPSVEGVPTELRQLFNNLLSNAIKFRKKDVSPVITISSHKLAHKEKSELLIPFNQTYFRINVQDNGIGFDAAYSEKIFEIFQRLNGKSEYSGSGIGLAICKKIVESHDGIIYASAEPEVGSTFSIILPENQFH